eukprot:7963872-Lingulodinium_polyedra.AAC.1
MRLHWCTAHAAGTQRAFGAVRRHALAYTFLLFAEWLSGHSTTRTYFRRSQRRLMASTLNSGTPVFTARKTVEA